jgi:hypothetical protein
MIKALKSKIMNAIPALLKFLVLIAIFLLASNANSFTSLSPVAGNQVQEKHWFQLEEPMNDPTNEPSCKPISKPMNEPTCKPTNDLSIDSWQCRMEINKMNSKKKTQPRGQCQDKISERVTFCKQEKDAELPYHLLPKHTCQAMIINTFSSMKSLLPRSSCCCINHKRVLKRFIQGF